MQACSICWPTIYLSVSLAAIYHGAVGIVRLYVCVHVRVQLRAPLCFEDECMFVSCHMILSYVRLGRGLAKTRRRRDDVSLAESLWGMGGTLVTDECHLFAW